MYKRAPLLQYIKRPTDAISPSVLKLGLADRIAFAKSGGAIVNIAAKLAKTGINTPWTTTKGVSGAIGKAARDMQSTLTRGGSEVARGLKNAVGKLKFW